jgi:hypothetical protein
VCGVSTVATARQDGGNSYGSVQQRQVTHASDLVVMVAISCLGQLATIIASLAHLAWQWQVGVTTLGLGV